MPTPAIASSLLKFPTLRPARRKSATPPVSELPSSFATHNTFSMLKNNVSLCTQAVDDNKCGLRHQNAGGTARYGRAGCPEGTRNCRTVSAPYGRVTQPKTIPSSTRTWSTCTTELKSLVLESEIRYEQVKSQSTDLSPAPDRSPGPQPYPKQPSRSTSSPSCPRISGRFSNSTSSSGGQSEPQPEPGKQSYWHVPTTTTTVTGDLNRLQGASLSTEPPPLVSSSSSSKQPSQCGEQCEGAFRSSATSPPGRSYVYGYYAL